MNDKLESIVIEILGMVPNLNNKSQLADFPDWDSMNHMLLITKIENSFGIQFSGDEIADLQTFGGLQNLVQQKLGS